MGMDRRRLRESESRHFECRQGRKAQELEAVRDNETYPMHDRSQRLDHSPVSCRPYSATAPRQIRPAVMADQAPKGHVMNGGKYDLRRAARTASFKARNR